MKYSVIGLTFFLMATAQVFAIDRVTLEETVIQGNRESPKSLNIVPWKTVSTPDIHGAMPDIDGPYPEPLDPAIMNRRIKLFEYLHLNPSRRENQP